MRVLAPASHEASVEQIFSEALRAVAEAQSGIFGIAESAREEYDRLKAEVSELKAQTAACIAEVDRREKAWRRARSELARVSRHFGPDSEAAIKAAYMAAERERVALSVAQEREAALRRKRDDLERSLLKVEAMVRKAEQMATRMSIAVEWLSGGLERLAEIRNDQGLRREIAVQVVRAREDERGRLAREIHDGPAQSLAHVTIQAAACERLAEEGHPKLPGELRSLKESVRASLRELRQIIFNLRPQSLQELGLPEALRRCAAHFCEMGGPPIDVKVDGRVRSLDPMVETVAYRVIQESLQNAFRHAEARRVQVRVGYGRTHLRIAVRDDGKGIEGGGLSGVADRYGIEGMRDRVELAGGQFKWISAPGRGTTVWAAIPLEAAGSPAFRDTAAV